MFGPGSKRGLHQRLNTLADSRWCDSQGKGLVRFPLTRPFSLRIESDQVITVG
jgi:hypothetical protein